MQPNQPTDFEVLTAIVSRACIGFMDLEQIFPGTAADAAAAVAARLRDGGLIDTFWERDGDARPAWKDLRLAVRGYHNDLQVRRMIRNGYDVAVIDDEPTPTRDNHP